MCHTASASNYPSENIIINTIWGQSLYYNQKQTKVLSFNMEKMAFLPPSAPYVIFERETYMAIYLPESSDAI